MNANSVSADKKITGAWNASLGDWDPSLETGMELVDKQHEALFMQIRILLDHSQADRVQETLEFMAVYVVEHFETEERLHRETEYPQGEEHLDAHNFFITVFKELKQEYDASGYNLIILMKIARFLLEWLRKHIRGQDQRFAEYFRRFHAAT